MVSSCFVVLLDKSRKGKRFHHSTGERTLFSTSLTLSKTPPFHMPPSVKNCLTIAISSLAFSSLSSQAAINFEKQILPILQKKCLDCHSATKVIDGKPKKPKGDLRLDAAWALLKGAENGPSIVPGNLAKSYMHEVVNLPKDDDMFMPPKGDPMTIEEIKLLKEWIESGSDFGGWTGNMEGAPADAVAAAAASTPKPVKPREHDLFYSELSKDLKPAAEADIAKAKAGGAQISLLKADGPLLRADFLTGVSKCDDTKIALLLPLKNQIAQLDLGRTVITDAALKTLSEFSHLAVLDLRQTKITDAGLAALTGLQKLQTLNLYGTEITDTGLKSLLALKNLKQVTAFQTKITPSGVKLLTDAIPSLQVTLK
jgi:Leucine-rich repeat (LRR) protein